jgi:LCP family protein required for cell wall assembly
MPGPSYPDDWSGSSASRGQPPPLPPELDPRGRKRARASASARAAGASGSARGGPSGRGGGMSGRTAGRRALLTVCTLISIVLLVLAGTYWWKFHQFKSNLDRVDIASAQQSCGGSDSGGQNILVVGNDDRNDMTDTEVKALHTGRSGGSLNTDTMMIIHIPSDGSKATLVSLPRDSYVQIPHHGKAKLNSAYPDAYTATHGSLAAKRAAGANLLVCTVEQLTGVHIDHYAQVDLLGFYRISNAIGGVSVRMCAAVREKNSGIHLHKGVNVIKGRQALAFVRQRYNFPNGLGDLDRVKRQQYFLTAAFRKVASAGTLLNPFKLQDLLTAVQSSLFVDSSLDPLSLGRELENLTANNISGKTIPTDGFADTDVGSVVVVHPTAVRAFMAKVINPPARAPKKSGKKAKKPNPIDAKCIY